VSPATPRPLESFPDDLIPAGGRTKRRKLDPWILMGGPGRASQYDHWPVIEGVESARDERRAAGRNAATG